MKTYECEYTVTIKLGKCIMPDDHTEKDLKDKIKDEARVKLVGYMNGYIFDPNGKIITEEYKSEEIEWK